MPKHLNYQRLLPTSYIPNQTNSSYLKFVHGASKQFSYNDAESILSRFIIMQNDKIFIIRYFIIKYGCDTMKIGRASDL